MVVLVLSAFVIAPALAMLPEADACQPYRYDCAFNGRTYYGCGTQIPPSGLSCVLSVLEP